MKFLPVLALSAIMAVSGYSQSLNNSKNNQIMDLQSIENLLRSYESALNASDSESVLKLYTPDGVFMPSEAPTSIGHKQIQAAYNYVFSQIKLNIGFTIDKIEVEGDTAFARTVSRGTTDILASGINIPEENRELFVLKKTAGEWKIAQYIFNKMSPQK